MDLENTVLSESSQTHKATYCTIPFAAKVHNRHVCRDSMSGLVMVGEGGAGVGEGETREWLIDGYRISFGREKMFQHQAVLMLEQHCKYT